MIQCGSFECRSCRGTAAHEVVFSLGKLPLGNALVSEDELSNPEVSYPIDLVFCERCSLLQIRDPIPPEKLLEEYLYFTSLSPSLLKHGQGLAERLSKERRLGPESLVIEVGSNDGTLLECFHTQQIPVLGIEPVAKSARVAEEEHGVTTLVELFSGNLARQLRNSGKTADVIISNYVLELVPNLPDFVEGLWQLLKEDGIAVIEVPYAKDMVKYCRFDGIVHVRLSWFSMASLDYLFRNQGLVVFDIEYLPSFRGGTLRLFASKSASMVPALRSMLREETRSGVNSADFYRTFASKVDYACDSLRTFLRGLREKKKRIAAYGAGIKASTLLNYSQVGKELIDFVVDSNPYKHGRFLPGVQLPIYSPRKLMEEMPDYVLLLALDFTDEVLEQQAGYTKAGGRFIIPVPELKVV